MQIRNADEAKAGILEVRLFGHADVLAGGASVKFAKRATTIAMLALVVLARGGAMSRETLAFTLFPESDESSALAELRRYLYLASKALPERAAEPWLVVDAETVRWNEASGAFVDALAFERWAGDPERQDDAIALYAGDLLEGVYDDWAVLERERFRSRYLGILGESLERHRARRDFPAALAAAQRILAADPWREDVLRVLLAIRYEAGDAAGALAEFERFARRLRDDLDVAPMPETIAVRQSIVRGDALAGVPLVPGRIAAAASPRPPIAVLPFVGRERPMTALHAAWSRAAHGSGSLIVVAGEAGAGKSRLTAELARVVQSEGGRAFVGTTAAPETMPYQALVEALRSAMPLLAARPPATARRAVLAQLLPELRDPEKPAVLQPSESPERESARLFDALTSAVQILATPRPLLLVLEDLHWAGPATIEAIGAIVRDLARTPALIVATCRDEETPPDHPLRALQRALRVHGTADEIVLDRLALEDAGTLVAGIGAFGDRSEALAAELYAYSEGNALFLSEAISAALEGDRFEGGVQRSTSSIIAARLGRLGEEARAVAEIAAIAGTGCNVAVVRDVSNLPAAAVARGIDELLDRRLLREASARASYDYVFTHHLIAKAVYDRVEPAFRAQRHARFGRVLAAVHGAGAHPLARDIAHHFERAEDAATAAGWYLWAARYAASVHANADAIDLATRAVENGTSLEVRRAALDARERAFGRRGDRDGQRADIDELERLAGDDAARFDAMSRRVLLMRSLGNSEEEGRCIARLEQLALGLDDAARARALVQRATHAGLRSRPAEALAPAREALQTFEALGDVAGQLECLFLLVDYTANIGDLLASRAYLERMRERAPSVSDRVVEARALAVAATAALLRKDYAECAELTKRGLAINVATGDREAEAASRGRLAVTAAWLGDFPTALEEFAAAIESYESIGNRRGLALTHTNHTLLLMRLGYFDDALRSIERSNALFAVASEQRTVVANRVNESFVRLLLGDAAAARTLAESALGDARQIGFPVFEAAALQNLGNAELALGAVEAAVAHMEAGIALRRPLQEVRDFADDLADLTLAYVAAGRNADAGRLAAELESVGPSFEGALWPHYIWWGMAQGFAAAGDERRGAAARARAREELNAFAARIPQDAMRSRFLTLPVHRRIVESR